MNIKLFLLLVLSAISADATVKFDAHLVSKRHNLPIDSVLKSAVLEEGKLQTINLGNDLFVKVRVMPDVTKQYALISVYLYLVRESAEYLLAQSNLKAAWGKLIEIPTTVNEQIVSRDIESMVLEFTVSPE